MVLPAVMCQTGAAAADDEFDDLPDYDLCKPEVQSNAWYKCVSCCQGLLPYYTAGNRNPYEDARSHVYDSKDLSSTTLERMCNDPVTFVNRFKVDELDLKQEQKRCCVTEEGTNEFFANKTKCFFKCDKNPEDLSYCQSVSEWSVSYVNKVPREIPRYHGTVRGEYCWTAKDDQGCCMFSPPAGAPLEKVCPSDAPASYVCKSDADTCLVIDSNSFRTFCPDGVTNLKASYTRPKPPRQVHDPLYPYIQDIYACIWEREALGSRQQIAAEAAFRDWCTSRNGKLFGVDNPFCECRNFNTDKNGESQLDKFQRECRNFKGIWSNDSVSPTPQAKP